jgi:hypothetical protein
MRTHDINGKQQQIRALKRFIKLSHKKLSRFPRRFNKYALSVHKNTIRAFFSKFLGFTEQKLLSL